MIGETTLTHRFRLGFGALLACAALAGAAAAQTAEEPAPQIFTDTVDVQVVEVEVIATDGDGNPVHGLTRDDFQLFEDDKPVELSNFYAVDEGAEAAATDAAAADEAAGSAEPTAAPPSAAHRLNLVIFVDNLDTAPLDRNRVFALLHAQLRKLLGPDDRVMVASFDRSLHIEQRFCQDLDLVFAALDRSESNLGGGALAAVRRRALNAILDAPERDVPEATAGGVEAKPDFSRRDSAAEALRTIHSYAQEAASRTEQMLAAMASFVDSLAALPGRRALLVISGGIQLKPGEDLFDAWTDRLSGTYGAELGVSSALSESERYDQHDNLAKVLDSMRASQVVIYGLSVSGNHAAGSTAVEVRAGQVGSTSLTRALDPADALDDLAGESGGLSLPVRAKSAPVLDRMASDFSSYYSLAYTRPKADPGSDHRIEVKTTRPGIHLRYRRAYHAKAIADRAEDRAMTALFHDVTANPLGVRLELGTPQREQKDRFLVTLTIRVPFANLLLFPEAEAHKGLISVVIAVQDSEGRLARPQRVQVPVSIPNAKLLTALTEELTYEAKLEMRGGEQKLAVAVADDLAAVTSTVNLTVPVTGG
jgi:VWFA-related protein